MTDTTIAKTEFPMFLSGATKTRAYFKTRVEDPADRYYFHEMDRQVWIDLGSPGVITLAIEPGDRLNEEAS